MTSISKTEKDILTCYQCQTGLINLTCTFGNSSLLFYLISSVLLFNIIAHDALFIACYYHQAECYEKYKKNNPF
jgi:hypothetical protein